MWDWTDKVVLVTGGTGSFGQAFTKSILGFPIRALRIFSRDEHKQELMAERFKDERIRFILGDVRDRDALMLACDGVDLVVHAAALKRVPAGEYSPDEFIKTNVDGARNLVFAARERNVARVIALSTDKAVAAINVYGRTKALAESFFVAANAYTAHRPTRFSVVRYGNVVGSRGSVVPRFIEQRDSGQPLTITRADMTRFWITLKEATDFVIHRVENMEGGEIFVPQLPSATVADIAEAVAPGVETRELGIRPGEKLHEVLIAEEEMPRTVTIASMDESPYYVIRHVQPDRGIIRRFAYSSDNNVLHQWGVKELRAALAAE